MAVVPKVANLPAPGAPQIRAATRAALGLGMSRLERRGARRVGRQVKAQQAKWVDPYPWVTGTLPEKLVFAFLAQHGIPFTFQASFPDYPGTISVEELRPDFLLEQFKVILEIQGEYWHSLPDQAAHDVTKFAIYELSGYAVYWFWESDILTRLSMLMLGVKEIAGYVGTNHVWTKEENIDDLAGLRSMNSRSRRVAPPNLARR